MSQRNLTHLHHDIGQMEVRAYKIIKAKIFVLSIQSKIATPLAGVATGFAVKEGPSTGIQHNTKQKKETL
jgi:hypothetical protein